MPTSRKRKRGGGPSGATRANRERREDANRSERAMKVGFTHRWSFLWWTPIALAFGFGSQLLMNLLRSNFGNESSLINIMMVMLVLIVVTAVPSFLIVLGTARSSFTMRSIRETLTRFRWSNGWFDRMIASMIFPVILACLTVISFRSSASAINWSWMVLLASAFFPINAALKFAYTEQYREFTLDPRELQALVDERQSTRELGFFKRLRHTVSLKRLTEAPRDRMLAPTLQTILVWMAPSLVISVGTLLITEANGAAESVYRDVNSVIAPFSFVALQLATFAWAKWHMYGGVGRVMRVSNGRPLEPIF